MTFTCSIFIITEHFLAFGFTEELQKQLVEQVELRKKLEREFQHLKGREKKGIFLNACCDVFGCENPAFCSPGVLGGELVFFFCPLNPGMCL